MKQLTRNELFTYLDSDANEYGLDSISAHGFLTATLVGKPLKMWLPAFFDDNLDTIDENVIQALTEWQEEISQQLKNEQTIDLEFLEQDEDVAITDESNIEMWSVGFVDAMYAETADDWFSDADTEDDVAMLTLPMIVFSGVDEEDPTLQDLRSDRELLVQMANKIEANLIELFLLFHTND